MCFWTTFLKCPTARRRLYQRPRCPGRTTRTGRPQATTTPGRRRVPTFTRSPCHRQGDCQRHTGGTVDRPRLDDRHPTLADQPLQRQMHRVYGRHQQPRPALQGSPRQAANSGDDGWTAPARRQHYGPGEPFPWPSSKRSNSRQQVQGHPSFLRGDKRSGTLKGLPCCRPHRHRSEPSDNPRAENILRTNACEHGLGGYSLKTGRAWRWEIPLHLRGRKSINFLEFLACVVRIMLSIEEDNPAAGYCYLSATGNTSAMGRLRKSNFFSNGDHHAVHLGVAREFTSELLRRGLMNYSQ